MTAEFEVLNGETIVRFEYQAITQKVQDTADDAAHWIFETSLAFRKDETTLFEDYTNQEKLDMLDRYWKWRLKDYARSWNVKSQSEATKQTAWDESEDKYL